MDKSFYVENRRALYDAMPDASILAVFAGAPIRKTADEYYPFFPHRNFVYLTGLGEANAAEFVLMAEKEDGKCRETLFLLPTDPMAERWQGRRVKPEAAAVQSGIESIALAEAFPARFHAAANSGRFDTLCLDMDRLTPREPDGPSHAFAKDALAKYPYLRLFNALPALKSLRTIKKPCEIAAMRRAIDITGEGILDMMRASRPGMYEYEYKALFDAALTRNGVLAPGFPPIISAGRNNFYIHYYEYTGKAQDGDMILNDVGARWDFIGNDVSRGWPCNGKFSERQRLLYTCAYETSEHMFATIRPGMPMASVDQTARKYCYERLRDIGLADRYEDVGKLIWHGGAHHVGFDTHDVVDMARPLAPGMIFCVDVGIYCEEWGIGFRLEDNCLVTEAGCENLSAGIPRSIADIEAAMG